MAGESCTIYFKPKNQPLEKLLVKENHSKYSEPRYKYVRRTTSPLLEHDLNLPSSSPCKASDCEVPKSLYKQCLTVVASNTEWIESLDGFPEDVGSQIWDTAVQLEMFNRPGPKTSQSLSIFTSAYPSLLLPSCVLASLTLINDYQEELLQLLRGTRQLDLTACGLDDQHDLVTQLSSLARLEVLVLAQNDLTDVGVRNIVLPCVGGRKLSQLEYIDVSCNNITGKGLKRLELIPSLKRIVLAQSDFTRKQAEEYLKPYFVFKARPVLQKFGSCGLATELLKIWRSVVEANKKPTRSKSSFYSKKTISVSCDTHENVTLKTSNKFMFERLGRKAETIRIDANKSDNVLKVSNGQVGFGIKRKIVDDDLEGIIGKKPRYSKRNDYKSRKSVGLSNKMKETEKESKEIKDYEENLLNIYG